MVGSLLSSTVQARIWFYPYRKEHFNDTGEVQISVIFCKTSGKIFSTLSIVINSRNDFDIM